MIGAIISGALQVGSSIVGGIKAAKERQKRQEAMDNARREWDAWFTRERYADPTARASARWMLNKTAQEAVNRLAAAKGRGAIMGNADASVAAAQEANAKGMADATGQVVAMNDARTDKISEEYRQGRKELLTQELNERDKTMGYISDAIKGTAGVAQAIFGNEAGEEKKPKA